MNSAPVNELKSLFFVTAILAIIIVMYQMRQYRKICENALEGFWAGDDRFLMTHGLRDMQWYLSPGANKDKKGYFLAADDAGDVVADTPFTVAVKDVSSDWSGNVKANVVLSNFESQALPLPEHAVIRCDLLGRCMEIRDLSGTTIFSGYRDNYATNAAKEEWDLAPTFEGEDSDPL